MFLNLLFVSLNGNLQWKRLYNGATTTSISIDISKYSEIRMRLKLSGNPYTAYQSVGAEKSDMWVTFAVHSINIASMQFSINNGILSCTQLGFVGNWTQNTFALEVDGR